MLAMVRRVLVLFVLAGAAAHAQHPATARLQEKLDSVRMANRWPGVSLAVALPDGSRIALASGHSDTTRRIPMRPTDRLLQGSVGKTYVSAVAMQLVHEKKLD